MPLLSGSHLNTEDGLESRDRVLYALENAFRTTSEYNSLIVKIFSDTKPNVSIGISFDVLGFTGWRLVSSGGYLWLLPPGFNPTNIAGNNGITITVPAPHTQDFPYTNCLVAYDKSLDSLLMAFYGSDRIGSIDDDTLSIDTSHSVIFLARDENGSVFGGASGPYIRPQDFKQYSGFKAYIGENGYLVDAGGQSPDVDIPIKSPFMPRSNINPFRLYYLPSMVNYTSPTLALAKSMKTGISVPVQNVYTGLKFVTKYQVGNRKFINFSIVNNDRYLLCPILDPWCPYE